MEDGAPPQSSPLAGGALLDGDPPVEDWPDALAPEEDREHAMVDAWPGTRL